MNAGQRKHAAGALIFGLIWGCQASVNADANVSGQGASAEGDADLHGSATASGQAEGQGEMTRAAATPAPAGMVATPSANAAPTADASRVLLGARHDLKLRPGKGTASCECLAVALGGANSGGMAWSAAQPNIDESTQLTIALSSDGQACKSEPKQSLGASYWGYRLKGNDVVVLVEAARGGRPMTSGAIIPKPVGPGQVYVAPAKKQLPYGRPLSGSGLCKIGNPGQVRTAPFTELEVGTNAPPATTGDGASQPAPAGSDRDLPTTIEMPAN